MSKYLVIGGGGFLGKALVKKLIANGHTVVSLARGNYPEVKALGAECIQGDICDKQVMLQACQGCDAVFHTASKAGIWGPFSEYERINVQGSRVVLEACQTNHVPILIYTSTPSVIYHPQAKIENIQEDVAYPTEFECAYAQTKAQAESELLKANGEKGVRIVALRPHLIYGPEDPHLIPRVVARAKTGQLPQVGDGKNKVDITYVDNAADAHLLAVEHIDEAAGKAYFISDGQPVELWPWINDLLRRIEVAPIKKQVSYKLAVTLGAVLEFVYRLFGVKTEPKMTRFTAAQLATSHYFNIANARRDLHYVPQVSGEEGLQRLADWIKAGGLEGIEQK